MQSIRISSLDDLVPHVSQDIVPHVKEAVQVCLRSYADDPFNDNWTFGTQLWKNTWNRIKATAEIGSSPIKTPTKGNEFSFSIGNATIHHHRVGGDSLLPKSAKKIKEWVEQAQLPLFPQKRRIAFDNVILGISADPANGLSEVFLGKLEKDTSSNQYFWSEKVSLFKEHITELGTPEYIFFEEEAEAIPVLTLGPQTTEHAQPETKGN